MFRISSWWHGERVKATVRFSGREVRTHRVTNPYHAVSIKAGPSCGGTEREHAGRLYLSTEAPVIPLPSCDTGNCRCRYIHHEDRRDGSDRRQRSAWHGNAIEENGRDRRRDQGRRVIDQ